MTAKLSLSLQIANLMAILSVFEYSTTSATSFLSTCWAINYKQFNVCHWLDFSFSKFWTRKKLEYIPMSIDNQRRKRVSVCRIEAVPMAFRFLLTNLQSKKRKDQLVVLHRVSRPGWSIFTQLLRIEHCLCGGLLVSSYPWGTRIEIDFFLGAWTFRETLFRQVKIKREYPVDCRPTPSFSSYHIWHHWHCCGWEIVLLWSFGLKLQNQFFCSNCGALCIHVKLT